MKRFYCTICKRTKRVRKYPASVQDTQSASPVNRIGQCAWHKSVARPEKVGAR